MRFLVEKYRFVAFSLILPSFCLFCVATFGAASRNSCRKVILCHFLFLLDKFQYPRDPLGAPAGKTEKRRKTGKKGGKLFGGPEGPIRKNGTKIGEKVGEVAQITTVVNLPCRSVVKLSLRFCPEAFQTPILDLARVLAQKVGFGGLRGSALWRAELTNHSFSLYY